MDQPILNQRTPDQGVEQQAPDAATPGQLTPLQTMGQMAIVIINKNADTIIEQFKAAGDQVPMAAAQAAQIVLDKLQTEAQKGGIPPAAVYGVAKSVVILILDLGRLSGVINPTMDDVSKTMQKISANMKQPQQAAQPAAPQPAGQPAQTQMPTGPAQQMGM